MAARKGSTGPGRRVRWKQGRSWRYGSLGGPVLEGDGSLRVYEDSTGGARSLRPERVWHEGRGPRGGLRWVPSTVAPVVIAAMDRLHQPAQLGMFNGVKQS